MKRSSIFTMATLMSCVVSASANGYFEVKDMQGSDAHLEPAQSTAVSPMSKSSTAVGTETDGYRAYHRQVDRRIQIPENYQLTASRRHQVLKEIGSGPAELVNGFADDVPFEIALELIIPKGWVAYVHPETDAKKLVSFDHNQSWINALQQIILQTNSQGVVSWGERVVRVDPLSLEESALMRAKVTESVAHGTSGPIMAASTSNEPPVPLSVEQFNNELISARLTGVTLREVMAAIAPSGWYVELQIPATTGLLDRKFDFRAENRRAIVMNDIEKGLGIHLEPFYQQRLIVATAAE